MLNNKLDQGSILYGVKSTKYPDVICSGIVISASCDIANKKVPKIYYVIAADAKELICTPTYYEKLYKDKVKTVQETFVSETNKNHLNSECLLNMSPQNVENVVQNEIESLKKRDSVIKAFKDVQLFCHPNDKVQIANAIKECPTYAIKYLSDVCDGKILNTYFLPEIAYRQDGSRSEGLILDFEEIDYLYQEDFDNIISPGIDLLIIDDYPENKQELYKQKFWLDVNNQYVKLDGVIFSPWREHIMQRFSHFFARIGLDNPSETDIKNLIEGV